jgi:hypothetical protein
MGIHWGLVGQIYQTSRESCHYLAEIIWVGEAGALKISRNPQKVYQTSQF